MKQFKEFFLILFTFVLVIPLFAKKESMMKISVVSNNKEIKFELNNSDASKDLISQLPLDIDVEDYASNEKIFYPPNKLSTSNTPLANAINGTLAYYAPWGDVVMFYKNFGSASGLYELGTCVGNCEFIKDLKGKITINLN